jgi:hypothetical protein
MGCPNPKPPRPGIADPGPKGTADIGASPPPEPKIDTRSSRGLLDVPARRLAAAGVCDSTSVAARPLGCPSRAGASSSKSLKRKDVRCRIITESSRICAHSKFSAC